MRKHISKEHELLVSFLWQLYDGMALEDTCRDPEMVCKEYNRHTLRPKWVAADAEDTSVLEVAPLNIIYAPADTEL